MTGSGGPSGESPRVWDKAERRQGSARVWDKAVHHRGGDWPQGLDPVHAFTHTGLFYGWCIERGLAHPGFVLDAEDAVARLRRREITAPRFFADACDGALVDDMLTDEGNAFAAAYFDFEGGSFLDDYGQTLAEELPSLYHVEDTWGNYDRLRAVLDRRLATWRAARPAPAKTAAAVAPRTGPISQGVAAAPAPAAAVAPGTVFDSVAARVRAPDWPAGRSRDAAAVPLGHYLAWCVERGLVNDAFLRDQSPGVTALRAQRTTGPRLALLLGGTLSADWLTDEGRAFTARYYAARYLQDVHTACTVATAFEAAPTWAAYAPIRDVLDRRLEQWRAKHGAAFVAQAPAPIAPAVAPAPPPSVPPPIPPHLARPAPPPRPRRR